MVAVVAYPWGRQTKPLEFDQVSPVPNGFKLWTGGTKRQPDLVVISFSKLLLHTTGNRLSSAIQKWRNSGQLLRQS